MPVIAITPGEPAGIGPDLVIKPPKKTVKRQGDYCRQTNAGVPGKSIGAAPAAR